MKPAFWGTGGGNPPPDIPVCVLRNELCSKDTRRESSITRDTSICIVVEITRNMKLIDYIRIERKKHNNCSLLLFYYYMRNISFYIFVERGIIIIGVSILAFITIICFIFYRSG